MITVGIDPGTKNYAIVALNARGDVFFARLLRSTIRSMSIHKAEQRVKYRATMRKILQFLRPDELIIETFVARGFSTFLAEVVNVMIGSVLCECDHQNIEEHAVMASSWKNAVGKDHLKQLYALGDSKRLPNHLVDAMMLATYQRHNKSFNNVNWGKVHANIGRVARLVPMDNLTKPVKAKKVSRGKKKGERR